MVTETNNDIDEYKRFSHLCNSGVTADIIIEESKPTLKERQYNKKINKLERRKKKLALERYMKRIYRKKRITRTKKGKGEMISPSTSIRTHHEEIFESYLKLLGQPYLINQIFCFGCNNFYTYGDHLMPPKKCQVCNGIFHIHSVIKRIHTTSRSNHIARPDFILDFNTEEMRARYKHDTHHHQAQKIEEGYRAEYMKKVSIIRIDGSIHQKKTQRIKDYHQYNSFRDAGVKVFIVQNIDIDDLLSINDNGRSMLKLCKYIGDATIDDKLYAEYCKGGDFKERISRPFGL